MISNTDSTLLIYSTEHILVKVYTGRGHPLAVNIPLGRLAEADEIAQYPFDTESEDYLIHITTGTHVAQICLFLLTESRYMPGRLVQCSPERNRSSPGTIKIIDLDLSKYDRIASQREAVSYLKGGIDTRNSAFNHLIDRIEQVAVSADLKGSQFGSVLR